MWAITTMKNGNVLPIEENLKSNTLASSRALKYKKSNDYKGFLIIVVPQIALANVNNV